MAEQIEQAARTAGRTFNISLAELAGANAGQRNDLLALNQAVYRVPDGTLYTSDGAQLVPAQGLPVMASTNPLTGGIELTAGGEVIEVGGGGASELPYDTVSLTATTAAIRSAPCQVAGLSCSASTSLNVRVYANSANSGTVIWEGALTAGQVVALPAPYSSFIGLSAQIVSGSGTFAIYVR